MARFLAGQTIDRRAHGAVASWPPDLAEGTLSLGSLQLPDQREFGEDLEQFLSAGEPPVYVGFGSMVDPDPAKTSALIIEAASRVGCRLLLASGWAGIGGKALGPRVRVRRAQQLRDTVLSHDRTTSMATTVERLWAAHAARA